MKVIVCVSDLQVPYHDRKAVSVLSKFIKQYKPDEVVSVGDEMDMQTISKWSGGTDREHEKSIAKDRDETYRVLESLKIKHMIRRIRIAADHALVQVCRDHGYPVEYQRNFDGSEDHSTMVVSFPFCYPEGTKLAAEMTAIDQLEVVKWLQAHWSDNSVSCTVYYRKEELPEIKKYLAKNYKNNHKSLSFLLHNEHGFHQAPLEEITKEQYDELVAKTRLITKIDEATFDGGDECASGACPVK